MIVIADRKAVYELVNKKGNIYSDRPDMPVQLFMVRGCHMTFESQTASWREKRTLLTRNLNPQRLDEKHFRIQEAEYFTTTTTLLLLLLLPLLLTCRGRLCL